MLYKVKHLILKKKDFIVSKSYSKSYLLILKACTRGLNTAVFWDRLTKTWTQEFYLEHYLFQNQMSMSHH